MKVFPAKEVQEIDRLTIEYEPIASIQLMERAANQLTEWFIKRFKINHSVFIFVGQGNNGGDGLAMARMLAERQFSVSCCMLTEQKKLSADSSINFERLVSQDLVNIIHIKEIEDIPEIRENAIIVDAIFGSGLSRKVEGTFASIIQAINNLSNIVMSIDIPSGLFGEDNTLNDASSIIRADYTLSFQFPFLSFFFSENSNYLGEWFILDIRLHKNAIEERAVVYKTIERGDILSHIPERPKFSHKGTFGHALLVGGSYGMMGAVILASEAVLRTGAGLVSAHVPVCGLQILQAAFPEAIASVDPGNHCFSELPELKQYNAIAVGPGLGDSELTYIALENLLDAIKVPLLIDADAINIISSARELISKIPEGSVITPHPKEFDRLAGDSESGYERHLKQIEFSKRYKLIIVLKGAHTGVSFPDGSYFFNTSGNPGMATGGSGDVLTGIIVSLLAQHLRADEATLLGVYLHGLAGDIAALEQSEAGLVAGDIVKNIGKAWIALLQ